MQMRAAILLMSTLAIGSGVPAGVPAQSAASSPLPADSVYQVNAALETAEGHSVPFASHGRVRVVTMFYASCPMACPLIIDTLRNLDAALTASQRAQMDILLVSMDPERDTPAALAAVVRERKLTDARWTLARASVADTRKLAAILGIQYRKLDTGDFDHASVLILLDPQGRVLARSQKLGVPEPEFIERVQAAIRAAGSPGGR